MQTQSTQLQQLILIITGMHRSGTSLTASLLQSAGVSIGKRFESPNAANVKGYFENLDFVRFHEEVLYSQGIRKEGWTLEKKIQVQAQYLERAKQLVQENSSEPIWGWKDPRTALFLDFWADFILDSKFIFVYRSPWEVVDSLYRRSNEGDDVFDCNPNFAIKLWINYNQVILDFYNRFSERCILLSLVDIAHEPGILIEAIKEKFGVSLSLPNRDIYESSLLHNQVSSTYRPALIKQYFPAALDLYDELNTKALLVKDASDYIYPEQPHLPIDKAWILQDWLNVRTLEKQKSELQKQLQQLQVEWERVQSHLQNTQEEYNRLHSHVQHIQAELERSQSQLQYTQAELERSHSQLHQMDSQLHQMDSQLHQMDSQLHQTQLELGRSQGKITAMESSKFWKLRTAWFRLKKFMKIKGD